MDTIAVANAHELLKKMTEKCFSKCIVKPGTSLDNSETLSEIIIRYHCKCLNLCVDRFVDAYNITTKSYGTRIQKEKGF
ncbi:unnamed protein product [Medioppia subpectinata]|uniref:Mitochondrial import inner membrane translocase subunit n=1 Tax=Medioppia subpectinata TaxID=1979941 RepID=A0A7R9KGB1_9ACAR|nr:unnamed protein product [Medioppia subpectinata]CAG2102843.1 unnamed protein product [Medioppia subpectinata]